MPDSDLSLRGGALAPWAKTTSKYYMQTLESLSQHFGFSIDVPFRDLDSKAQQILLYGSGNESVQMTYDDGLRSYKTAKPFEGIIPNLTRRFVETDSNWVRDELDQFRAIQPCDACHGKRLKSEALAVKIKGKDISDISVCLSAMR